MNLKEACGVVEFVKIHEMLYKFKITNISLHITADDSVILRLDISKNNITDYKNFGENEQKKLSQTEIQGLILEYFKDAFAPRCEKCGQLLNFEKS